jgi:hypothetical protein
MAPALARRRVASACIGWPQALIQDALEVGDENPSIPRSGMAPPDDGLGGRGLLTRPTPNGLGKSVWFDLEVA